MKPAIIKASLIAAAAALLIVSVEAQQSVRTRAQQDAIHNQVFGFAFSGGGGTTGGNGGVIIGPAPTVLSPITVVVPLP